MPAARQPPRAVWRRRRRLTVGKHAAGLEHAIVVGVPQNERIEFVDGELTKRSPFGA